MREFSLAFNDKQPRVLTFRRLLLKGQQKSYLGILNA